MTTYYGLDVGARRIGVARTVHGMVVPVETIYRDKFDNGIDRLVDIIDQQDSDTNDIEFVVGLPLLMSGKEGAQAGDVRRWVEALRKRFPSSAITYVDERLSSVQAHEQLRQAGRATKEHRPVIDQQAAVVILERALHNVAMSTQQKFVADEGSYGEYTG